MLCRLNGVFKLSIVPSVPWDRFQAVVILKKIRGYYKGIKLLIELYKIFNNINVE